MTLSDKLLNALNEQITLELTASVVYFQLSTILNADDLPGMGGWMQAQSDEERDHARVFTDHVLDRGGRVVVGGIDAPTVPDDGTALSAFKAALDHEKKVSEAIRDLYRLAAEEGDADSIPLLLRFIEEQVEEEATVSEIVGRLERANDDATAILYLDSELASRRDGGETPEL
ncbi:MAG: ferritin [Acidimicrobiia bacterium]|nr:ferritin [Acidimicrobiia bacterium]